MPASQPPKEYRLNLRLSEQEWNKIHKLTSKTTCRSVSDYCRKVLLNEPVRVFQRNQSFDDLEEDLAPLLPMLKTFGDDMHAITQSMSPSRHQNGTDVLLEVLLLRSRQFIDLTTQIKDLLIKISDACGRA